MIDCIEKVIYINLEHRTDRKAQVESELLKVFPCEKVVRFNAIKHTIGGIGCSMSHIGAVELAIKNNWNNVLIVEDDLQWYKLGENMELLANLASNPYDVIMLSGHNVKMTNIKHKLYSCCARTAYLVNNHYYHTLLSNFKDGLALLTNNYTGKHRGDIYWNQIQKRDNWFIIRDMCIQRPSFSDIEQRMVNYSNFIHPKRIGFLRKGKFLNVT